MQRLCVLTALISFLEGHFSVSMAHTLNSSYDIGHFNEVDNYVINADCVKPRGCIFSGRICGSGVNMIDDSVILVQ